MFEQQEAPGMKLSFAQIVAQKNREAEAKAAAAGGLDAPIAVITTPTSITPANPSPTLASPACTDFEVGQIDFSRRQKLCH